MIRWIEFFRMDYKGDMRPWPADMPLLGHNDALAQHINGGFDPVEDGSSWED